MEQGYQTFKQYYIEPIKKVSEMISRTAVRSASHVARGVAHETARGVKAIGRELYNCTIKSEYQLWQTKRRKKAELKLEMEYSQKRCDNYVVRFKTEISPKLENAGIPKGTCERIKNQWISLASPDLNPFESIIDFGTLQKGYEIFNAALLNGNKNIIRDSVKNWDSLYEARESMRGSERMYYERAKEHMNKDAEKTASKDTREKSGFSKTTEKDNSAHSDHSHAGTSGRRKTGRTVTPDEAREMGSKAVRFQDGMYMRNADEHLRSHGVSPEKAGADKVRKDASKAAEDLKKEERKTAERANKAIDKALSSMER